MEEITRACEKMHNNFYIGHCEKHINVTDIFNHQFMAITYLFHQIHRI